MKIKNEYKIRPLCEVCDIIEDYADSQDFLKTGYLGEYLIRTPEQLQGRYAFYRQVLKINFNAVVRTIRYYDENNECEYKIDILPDKNGSHYLTYSVYDDEIIPDHEEENVVRTLKLKRVKIVLSEESYFQESTISDYGDISFDDIQAALHLFNTLIPVLKDKFNDNIGSIIVPKEAKYDSTKDLDVFRSSTYNTDYLHVRFASDDSWSKYIILAEYDPMSGVDWYTIFTIDKAVSYIRYEIISNTNEVLCSCTFNYPMTEESFFQDSLVNDYQTLTFKDALELPKYFTAKRITPRDQY